MLTWGYADKKVSSFPRGRVAKVFYDPVQPEVSCLERGGVGWEDVFMLLVSVDGIFMALRYVYLYLAKLVRFNEAERFVIHGS